MKDFDQIKADLAADLDIANRRGTAIDQMDLLRQALLSLGFRPELGAEEVLDRELVFVRVDLQAIETCKAPASDDIKVIGVDMACEPDEAVQMVQPLDLPDIEDVKPAPEKDPVPEPEAIKDPAPKPKAKTKKARGRPPKPPVRPKPKPVKARRAFGKADPELEKIRAQVIDLSARGVLPAAIAKQIGADPKRVANLKQRHKADIEKRKAEIEGASFDLDAHIEELTYGDFWTPVKDIRFVELLDQGSGVAGAGAVLRANRTQANARHAILFPAGSNLTTGQLLAAMRARQNEN